jgi:predicted DNA-binding transcriptional regulator AlpA
MTEKKSRRPRAGRRNGTHVVWPAGLEDRYGISAPTRWRWEREGKLPPRDVFVGGRAIGWRPETLAASESAPHAT